MSQLFSEDIVIPERNPPLRSFCKIINEDGSYKIIYDDNGETIHFPKPNKLTSV